MPNITNRYNYPQCVVNAALGGLAKPQPDIIRVTELIGPPAIRYYLMRDWDRLTWDVDDELRALLGTAWHKFLAGYMAQDTVCEERLYMKDEATGITITGQLDVRTNAGIIEDHKTTSAWSFVFDKSSWVQQLNCYALLSEANGYHITDLSINAFLVDWMKSNAYKFQDYPKTRFHSVRIPLWKLEDTKVFMQERLHDHLSGLRACTPEERWQRETTWAVKKQGVATAKRVLATESMAQEWIAQQDKKTGLYIEQRVGGCIRCASYCPVRGVCEFNTQTTEDDNGL